MPSGLRAGNNCPRCSSKIKPAFIAYISNRYTCNDCSLKLSATWPSVIFSYVFLLVVTRVGYSFFTLIECAYPGFGAAMLAVVAMFLTSTKMIRYHEENH